MKNDSNNISLSVQELQILADLCCDECRENIRELFKMWHDKRTTADDDRTRDIETEIEREIEIKIQRSDD